MTLINEIPKIEQKIVVTFDICSSTTIIEDLHKTENITKWRDFLIWMKNYLVLKAKVSNYLIYKFTGDGWILLFDFNFPGDELIKFLTDFCIQFKMRYTGKIESFLETPPIISGMTFGIDRGSLTTILMNDKLEYVGRAINVACRLQSAIKDKDEAPQYKLLMTRPLYQNIRSSISKIKVVEVKRKLRNIAGGDDVHCVKMKLL
jgi:hypothetical protein